MSAGTRQLVPLARAICPRSKILLLDEATASTDYATDAVIQTCLRSRFCSSTILTIAHRPSLVFFADHVVALENGRIIEQGSYSELAARDDTAIRNMIAGEAVGESA